MKSPLDPVLNLPGVTVAGRSRLRGFYLFSSPNLSRRD
jgi:hypothetical protein